MFEFISGLFSTDFMPHGHCFFWRPEILWLHVFSDALTALSYLLIPVALIKLIRSRKDLAFSGMFVLFGVFILACGLTHILSIVVLWNPIYRLEGIVKLITALVSLPTAILLIRLVPKAAAIPSAADLEATSAAAHREHAYRQLADSLPQLVWTASPDGAIDYCNLRWLEFSGMTYEQTMGWGWATALHPDDLEPSGKRWMESVRSGNLFEHEYRFRRANDGAFRWFLARAVAARDQAGNIVKWFGTATDVHEEREVAKDRERLLVVIQDREASFRAITESMPQLVWSTRPDGFHDFFNQRWLDFTGTTHADVEGSGWSKYLHPDDQPHTLEAWNRALASGAGYDVELRLRGTDGLYRWFIARAHPVRDENGKILRWFGTSTDIDEQRRTREDLLRANEDLEHFAYAASHDLQEPLRAISLYGELVQRKCGAQLSDDARGYIVTMVNGAHRMSTLLSDLRGYIRSTDRRAAEGVRVEPAEILDEVRGDLAAIIAETGAEITTGELPSVWMEPVHLHQLLQNLLGNAMKYRREGVRPKIRIDATEDGVYWRFAVADNGLGIEPEYREKVFIVFKRLHGQRIPGTGIGLAICTRILERYRCRIWVDGNAEGGSTFYFTVPRGY